MTANSFSAELASPSTDLAMRAETVVAEHPVFRGRSIGLQIQIEGDTIVVRGKVPSFYLKQVLQNALRKLGGARYIDNQLVVVSSNGLSGQN